MSRRRRSLSRNLSLGILLLGIPIFVLSLGILFYHSRNLIRQETSENFTTTLNEAILRVRSYTNMIETATNANAWIMEENFNPESLQALSRRMTSVNPNITHCTISTQPDKRTKSVFDTGKACWIDSAGIASYCRPLRTDVGHLAGVVTVGLSISHLVEAINNVEQPYPHAYFVLVNGDGRYLIHPDTTSVFKKTLFEDHDPNRSPDMIALGYEMTAGKQGTMHVKSLAMVGLEDEVLASYQHLAYIIIVLILIGLVLGFWFCNRAVKRIISPIHRLLGMTEKITNGHYDEVMPLSDREDEIGLLQNSFAAMQQSLNSQMESIHDATDTLRQRNEDRVQDMETTKVNIQKKISFINSVLHQIRTPLSIITGFANMLRDSIAAQRAGDETKAISADYLNEICVSMKHNAIHLKRMVLMLFDSAETETSSSQGLLYNRSDEMSCNVLGRKCVEYTKSHYPDQQITFETELPDTTYILTNHFFLLRTIRELLANAVKYSDGQHIRLYVTETETTVRFIVEDEGPGLSEDLLDLTLKPLVEMDDQLEHSGLGLPMAYRHANGLGGSLIHDTSYPDGCRYILEIPK